MKKSDVFLFESQLKWTDGTKGIITSPTASVPIKVSTPKVFKAVQGGFWSPEDLLINAVSSCFMTTFFFYAKHKGLPVSSFDCEAIGQVEMNHGKLKFNAINIYPKIAIEKQEWSDMAKEVLELAKQNCLVSNSLNVIIYYHPIIQVKPTIGEKKPEAVNKKWGDIY